MNAHTTILPAMLASAAVPPIALLRALPPGPLAREFAHLERARRLADLFAAFDRDDMVAGVDLLIAELDARDGDPDNEPNSDDEGPDRLTYNTPPDASQLPEHRDAAAATESDDDEDDDPAEDCGDERDGAATEDEFMLHWAGRATEPGCPIADPGEDDADREGHAYAEWHTLPVGRRRTGAIDGKPTDLWRSTLHEDEEDDTAGRLARGRGNAASYRFGAGRA